MKEKVVELPKNFTTFYMEPGEITRAVIIPEGYANGSMAICLFMEDGELASTATVSLGDIVPDEGNVFIKDWSENEGTYDALLKAGVIGPIVRTIPTGFTDTLECKLKVDLDK